MQTAILVDGLVKAFKSTAVLNGVSLRIEPGTVYGLVGLNGAGKTTLLRLLAGILRPDAGSITVLSHNPWNHDKALYQSCGIVLENDGFWGSLTAAENLQIYAAAKGVEGSAVREYLATFWANSELFSSSKKVKQFSRGQRMQCALCRAFLGWPSVFLLDEPALALDMQAYDHFTMLVRHAREQGAAIIISSHQLDTIDTLCDRVGILRNGAVCELHHGSSGERTMWFIATSDDRTFRELIAHAGGSDIRYEQGWYFSLPDGSNATPTIVKSLVEAGGAIGEVRPIKRGFGDAIRIMFSGNQE